jgi:hypothetical protein
MLMTGTVIVQKCALLPVSAMAMDSVRVAEGGPTVLGSILIKDTSARANNYL